MLKSKILERATKLFSWRLGLSLKYFKDDQSASHQKVTECPQQESPLAFLYLRSTDPGESLLSLLNQRNGSIRFACLGEGKG